MSSYRPHMTQKKSLEQWQPQQKQHQEWGFFYMLQNKMLTMLMLYPDTVYVHSITQMKPKK